MQQGQPLAYMSQVLGVRNQALSVYKKELLALISAVTKWRHYFLGSRFIIRINHHSLKYLLEQKVSTALQQKWLTKLTGFDYEIQLKQGRDLYPLLHKYFWLSTRTSSVNINNYLLQDS